MTDRELLHSQIDSLPDDIVEQIADFTLFVMARRNIGFSYGEWGRQEWQDFAIGQLFSDDDEIEYTLKDAQEIYRP